MNLFGTRARRYNKTKPGLRGQKGFIRRRCLKFSVVMDTDVHTSNGKAVPLQAWSGPEGSWKLSFPDFMKTAQDGGRVVSLTHRPSLPPGNTTGTHFC